MSVCGVCGYVCVCVVCVCDVCVVCVCDVFVVCVCMCVCVWCVCDVFVVCVWCVCVVCVCVVCVWCRSVCGVCGVCGVCVCVFVCVEVQEANAKVKYILKFNLKQTFSLLLCLLATCCLTFQTQ